MKVYGLILALAITLVYFLITKKLLVWKKDFPSEKLLLYLFVGGVLGARIWHLLTDLALYLEYWQLGEYLAVFKIWRGGLSILGGITGGILALCLFVRKYDYPFYFLADLLVLYLPFGQVIGRLANYFNRELYGLPLDEKHWWALYIPLEKRLPGFESFAYYQPLFAYEILLILILWVFLQFLSKKQNFKLRKGKLFYLYLFTYLIIRFFLDFLRIDKAMLTADLGVNQGIIVFLLVILIIIRLSNAQKN